MTKSQESAPLLAPETPGAIMRRARLARGESLDECARITRIARSCLEHIERDRYTEMSAAVFARGQIASYARHLELDPAPMLEAYDRATGFVRRSLVFEPPTEPTRRAKRPSRAAPARRGAHPLREFVRPIHMAAALLMLIGLFATAFFLNGSSATAQKANAFENDRESVERDVRQSRWLLERPGAP